MSGKSKFVFTLFLLSLLLISAGVFVMVTYLEVETLVAAGVIVCLVGSLMFLVSLIAIIGWRNFLRYFYAAITASAVIEAILTLALLGDIVSGLIYLAISVLLVIGMVPICFKKR